MPSNSTLPYAAASSNHIGISAMAQLMRKTRRYSFTTLSEAAKDVQRMERLTGPKVKNCKRPRTSDNAYLEDLLPSKKIAFSELCVEKHSIPAGILWVLCLIFDWHYNE